MQVLPFRDVVIVQIQELQLAKAGKHLRARQGLQLVVGKVDFLEAWEVDQVVEVLDIEQVGLEIEYREVLAP